MDLRVQRTLRNITNAFITLRAKSPLEKITVKDLAAAAQINKATFYLHYRDVYDLSESLEDEVMELCLSQLTGEDFFRPEGFRRLALAFSSQSELFNTLFSGSRAQHAASKLDAGIKAKIYEYRPDLRDNLPFNIKLTAAIYGGFHAYQIYTPDHPEEVITALGEFSATVLNSPA